jgi:predicted nucleotidyltransferase
LLKENEERAIKSLKKELDNRFKLVDLWLFGSKARGDDTEESDVDVMIKLAETDHETESQIYDIVYEINLKNDTFISVIIFSKYEIDEGPMAESPIYKIIQKEGVLI